MNPMTLPRSSARTNVDPITLEVIRHGIISICDQIDANMTRTAFSPYIYKYKDYAMGFVGVDAQLLAQCTSSMPVFVADSIGMTVRDGSGAASQQHGHVHAGLCRCQWR